MVPTCDQVPCASTDAAKAWWLANSCLFQEVIPKDGSRISASEEARWTFILLFLVLVLTFLQPLVHLLEVKLLQLSQLFAQLSLARVGIQELSLPA